MRIGIINEYFPPHAVGGAEWSTYQLCKALAKKGHKVVVITPNYGAPSFERREGFKIYRYWFPKKTERGKILRPFWHGNPLAYFYSSIQLWRIARKEKLEVLHAQNKYSIPGALAAARLLGVPVLVTLREYLSICNLGICLMDYDKVPEDCGFRKYAECAEKFYELYCHKKSLAARAKFSLFAVYGRIDTKFRGLFLKRLDKLVAVSDGTRGIYQEFGIPPEKLETVYNIPQQIPSLKQEVKKITREKYALSDKKVILYVGKMSRGKGADTLVESIPRVLEKVPNALFLFVGINGLKEYLEKEIERIGIRKSVRFIGTLPHEEVLSLYSVANVVVVPSVWQEPFGRVIFEAMGSKKPVVGTRVGGIPELIIDGESGFIVERKNSKKLANAVVTILRNEKLERSMGEKGEKILKEKFDEDIIAEKMIKIYSMLVRR